MGLIREPRDVDFYVIDKSMTKEEELALSAYIKKRKADLSKNRATHARSASRLRNTRRKEHTVAT